MSPKKKLQIPPGKLAKNQSTKPAANVAPSGLMRGKSPTQQLFFVSLIANKRRLQFKQTTHNFLFWDDNDDGSPTLQGFWSRHQKKAVVVVQ